MSTDTAADRDPLLLPLRALAAGRIALGAASIACAATFLDPRQSRWSARPA